MSTETQMIALLDKDDLTAAERVIVQNHIRRQQEAIMALRGGLEQFNTMEHVSKLLRSWGVRSIEFKS